MNVSNKKLSKTEQLLADVIGVEQVHQILKDNRCEVHHHKWGKKQNDINIQFIKDDIHGDTISYCDLEYNFLTESWSAFGNCIDIGHEDSDRPERMYTFNDVVLEFSKIEDYWSREGSKPIIIKLEIDNEDKVKEG